MKERGYYQGAQDGVLGPLTKNAVIRFRKDNNYSAEFIVDECILGLMGIVIPPEGNL